MTCSRVSQFRASLWVCLIAPLTFTAPASARQVGWGPNNQFDGYWSHIDVPEIARLGPGDTGQNTPTRPGMTAPIDEIDDWSMDPRPGSDFDGGFVLTSTGGQDFDPEGGLLGWLLVVPELYDFIDREPMGLPARLEVPESLLPVSGIEVFEPAPIAIAAPDWGATVPGPAALSLLATAMLGVGVRRRRR